VILTENKIPGKLKKKKSIAKFLVLKSLKRKVKEVRREINEIL